jgi:hypothetical protein
MAGTGMDAYVSVQLNGIARRMASRASLLCIHSKDFLLG